MKQFLFPATTGNFLQDLSHKVFLAFISVDTYEYLFFLILKILLWYGLSRLLIRFGTSFIKRIFQHRALRFNERRTRTLESLVIHILRYAVYFVFFVSVLELLHVPVTTLLAGASVLGVAVGFGAQNLVRDVITGFFILFEDQFAVGDNIQTGSYRGTVEELGLRITKIRAWTGEVHILPNSSITQVTNFSKANSLAVMDIGVSYHEDLDRVFDVIRFVMEQAKADLPDIIGEPQILGVQQFTASEIVIRATVECKPTTHYAVQRELNRRIKKAFDEQGIEIPNILPVWTGPQRKEAN
jgi:moderate conductance mechanosensitive channel